MNRGFLTEEDIYVLSQYIEDLNMEGPDSYLNPYISSNDINEITIRDGFFNYVILPYAQTGENINKLVYYRLPRPESLSSVVEIYLLTGMGQDESPDFLKESLIQLKQRKLGITKVRVPMEDKPESQKVIEMLKTADFELEIIHQDELGKDRNVCWYAWMFER